MQDTITDIIQSHIPKKDKLLALQEFFSDHPIDCFVDFDDTLLDPVCIMSLKFIWLRYFRRRPQDKIIPLMSSQLKINESFISLASNQGRQSICIISRNNHFLIQGLADHIQQMLNPYNMTLVGSVGSILGEDGMYISTHDKIGMLPQGAVFVSDVCEARTGSRYELFYNVDHNIGWKQYVQRKIQKWTHFARFLFSH